MSAKLTYAATFVAFFAAAAAIQWPAASLQYLMRPISGDRWNIGGASGTVWNGGATLLLAENGTGRPTKVNARRWHAVQNVHWQLRWSDLWRGRLAVETLLEQGNVLVAIKPTGVSIEQLDAQLPATLLAGLISGPLGRYGWTGALHFRSSAFQCTWQGPACSGEIELLWMDAGVTEITGPALGSYRIRLIGEGSSVHFNLSTEEGRLQLTGSGEAGAGGLRFTGEAYATDPASAQLESQLRVLGRPAGTPGRYVLDYRDSAAPQ